jgi:hypothetical protein
MTHAQIVSKLEDTLEREAGTHEWWSTTEVGTVVNDIYRELANQLEMCKTRDTQIRTVASQAAYTLLFPVTAERIISVLDVWHEDVTTPLTPVTINILNNKWSDWRDATSGTPECWFFEYGSENTAISLQRKPSVADKIVSVEMIVYPAELSTGDSPLWPFTDGTIMMDGAMSYLLAKAGGGRDLDRADFYWAEMVSKIGRLSSRQLQPTKTRRFEDTTIHGTFSLGSKYPPYRFDD